MSAWFWIAVVFMYAAAWLLVPFFGMHRLFGELAAYLSAVVAAMFAFSTFGPASLLWGFGSFMVYFLVTAVTLALVRQWWWDYYYDRTKLQLRVRGAICSLILLGIFVGPYAVVRFDLMHLFF